jgi:hypothetical protein
MGRATDAMQPAADRLFRLRLRRPDKVRTILLRQIVNSGRY